MLKTALRQRHVWRQAGYDFPVSVNLSMRNLHDVGLPDEIERLLQGWRLPAGALELEITESSIMADPRARHGRDRSSLPDGVEPRHRRLRHRVLVAGPSEAAARATPSRSTGRS